jgi:Nitrate and nitrite sensing
MSGTVLDHWLVRGYLTELDAVMRGLPPAQASELREQITAHLDDALGPEADDYEVAATLRRLGSPADLAAEAGAASGSSGPRPALSGWRLATVIAVPAVIAAVFGGQQISSDASNAATFGRDQHLAQLNAAVVRLTQNLEDERDLSAGYVARRGAGPIPVTLADARTATDTAARAVQADAAGVGAGYQPGTVQDLKSLLASLTDLGDVRTAMSSRAWPASQVIQVYTDNVIGPAITFSAAVGAGTDDTRLQVTVTTLAALLGVENDLSVQRAVLYAALSAQPPKLLPLDLTSLTQAAQQQQADQTAFDASADTAEQQFFSNTVSGSAIDSASAQETLAMAAATANPSVPLTRNPGLDAATWYGDMSTTIDDTREVAEQAAGQITVRADSLNSNATRRLLLTSIITLLLLALLIVTGLARPLRRLVQMAHPSDGGRLSGMSAWSGGRKATM